MALTWTQVAQFATPNLPNDVTANSVSVAPVSGDTTPVGIKLGNGSSTLFSVDSAGKLAAAASAIVGNETVGGTLGVTGATTLASASATSLTVNGNESVTGTLSVSGLLTASGNLSAPTVLTGNGTTSLPAHAFINNTDTGAYLKTAGSSGAVLGLSVNATDAMTLVKGGVAIPGTLGVTGVATVNSVATTSLGAAGNPVLYSTQASTTGIYFTTTPAMVFTANGTAVASITGASMNVAQTLNAQGNLAVTGTSSFAAAATVSGTLTATNLTLASGGGGKLTFADGTQQTTAGTAGTSASFTATGNGTTSLPAFTYTNNTDTGAYLKTANATAAVLGLSVNATDALTLTKTGVTVPGTLAATGATTLSTATTSGLLTAANVTLSSGGKITFADGTTQNTSAASAAGSAAKFAATSNGSNTAPVFTSAQYTNTGFFFNPNNTTSTNFGLAVDGTSIATFTSSNVALSTPFQATSGGFSGNVSALALSASGASSTSTIGGNLTINKILTPNGTTNFGGIAALSQGSVTAPALTFQADTSTGFSLTLNPNTLTLGVGGASVVSYTSSLMSVAPQATFLSAIFTKSIAPSGTVTSSTPAGTASFVSTQGFKHTISGGGYATATGSAPTSSQQCQVIQLNNSTNTAKAYAKSFVAPFAGSVVGFSGYVQNALTTTCTFQMNVNGSLTSAISIPANSGTASITFPKGQFALPANGYAFMVVSFGSASTGADPVFAGDFTVEYGA